MSRSFFFVVGLVALAAVLLASCNCPPRPEPSTTGGGNSYGRTERRSRNIDRGWNPPPDVRMDKLEETPAVGMGTDNDMPYEESDGAMGLPPEAPFVPRGAGATRNGGVKSSYMPVRVQIGPKPVVLEAGRLDNGDELILVVTDAESEEVVFERQFAIVRTAARSVQQPDVAISPEEWEPEPGRYIIEVRRDAMIIGVEELTVPE